MGLREVGKAGDQTGARVYAHWLLPVAIIVASGLFAAVGTPITEALRYERSAIVDGEGWRLLTGHLVHLGAAHYAMNAVGLALVWLLVGDALRPRNWLLGSFVVIAIIDAGFWFLNPSLEWYVGASGLLHGLLLAGAAAAIGVRPIESVAIIVLVAAKLGYEQVIGSLPGSESTAGGPVVVAAHLYGAVGGLVWASIVGIASLVSTRQGRSI